MLKKMPPEPLRKIGNGPLTFQNLCCLLSASLDPVPFAPDSLAGWPHLSLQDVTVSISAFGRRLSRLSVPRSQTQLLGSVPRAPAWR